MLGVQTSGPQIVPGLSPTLSHVCITTDVPCMAGTKKSKFMKFLPVWIRNFLLMSLYLDYLSLFLRRD